MTLQLGTTLRSDRLTIRALDEADLEPLFSINGDDEVTRFLPYKTWRTMDDARAWLTRTRTLEATGNALQMVAANSGGAIIGTCLLFNRHEASARCELGYVLGRAWWGGGYMTEALRLVCGHAFGAMGLRRIEAEVNPRNVASWRVVERLGFKQEGLRRERYLGHDGQPEDSLMFGLLAREWPAAEAAAAR